MCEHIYESRTHHPSHASTAHTYASACVDVRSFQTSHTDHAHPPKPAKINECDPKIAHNTLLEFRRGDSQQITYSCPH